jgi:hypothetical protein
MSKIIVLDLGSESMCAVIGDTATDEFKEINLQCIDNIAEWEGISKKEIEDVYTSLLREDGKFSNRLLNKIALADNVVDIEGNEIDEDHAKLDFNIPNEYKNGSLFRFYHKMDEIKYLCNPKVAHVKGVDGVMPEIGVGKNKKSRISPNSLIKHLTVLVINNLILYSPECLDIDVDNCKLVLTFPNVYSKTHAKEILVFVKEHAKIKNVEYIYESDASAYALVGINTLTRRQILPSKDKLQLTKLADSISEIIQANEAFNVVAVDVGKGTTDMSLFHIDKNSDITVMARTGIAKAGNSLDYMFVEYFDEITSEFYDQKGWKRNLGFIHSYYDKEVVGAERRNNVNNMIQSIILEIKKNIKGNWCFRGSFSKQLRIDCLSYCKELSLCNNSFFAKLIELAKELYKVDMASITDNGVILTKEYPVFVARKIVGVAQSNHFFKKNIADFCFEHPIFYHLPRTLKRKMKLYVKLLGDQLPDVLRHNVEARINEIMEDEIIEDETNKIKENIFLLITGQASQFAPLNKELASNLKSEFSIGDDEFLSVSGIFSKKICCIGGFLKCLLRGYTVKNPDELLLDYFIRETDDKYYPIPYGRLNKDEEIAIEPLSNYGELWFSTLLEANNYLTKNEQFDKNMFYGFVKGFEPGGYSVRYIADEDRLKVNNEEVYLQSYGRLGDTDNIYESVWPELLKGKV